MLTLYVNTATTMQLNDNPLGLVFQSKAIPNLNSPYLHPRTTLSRQNTPHIGLQITPPGLVFWQGSVDAVRQHCHNNATKWQPLRVGLSKQANEYTHESWKQSLSH